jgi:hypothetical protein
MTGPDTGTNDVGAAQIGAMHTNVTQVFDQLQINLSIKGDPYWLGGRSDGANYQVGGVGLFLNVGVPRYPDDNTGLMLNKDDIFTYVISGFYVARNVMAVYSDGRFDMQLDCYRDTTLATNLVYPLLAAGRMPTVRSEVSSLPDLTNSTDNNPQDIANITDTADSFGPRAVGSDPPGGSSLPGNLNASLVTLLTNTANTTGVTINVTPEGGVRTGANNPSGRHDGSSADIVMTSNGRVLSVNNPADRPIILSFTETFVNNAKATGFVPSVGIGNPNINPATGQRYPDYMGNSAFHFDIAAGSAWSGSSATAWVPIWPELRRIIE